MKKEDIDKYIMWFSELGKKDVNEVGGKGANLGEMYNAKFPVPPGFVIVAQAYSYFLEETGLKEKIYGLLEGIDVENTDELDEATRKIREIIENAKMPEDMEQEVRENYEILSSGYSFESASRDVQQIMKKFHEGI